MRGLRYTGLAKTGGRVLAQFLVWGGLTGLCWLFPGLRSSLAAEWSLQPSLGTKAYYNSNLLLTPLPHDATYGYWVSPGADFAGKTERLEVNGRAAMDFVSYHGGEATSFTNIFLPLTARYKNEKDVFDFTGGYTRDNTFMGEFQTTGVVLRFTQRNLWTANPSWTRNVTEKLAFLGGLQFSDATYENGVRLGLVDYRVLGGSAGLSYQLTEQDQLQLTGTYTKFETRHAPFTLQATFPGAMLNLTHSFTETLTGTAFAGPRFINSSSEAFGNTVTTHDTVWVFGGSITDQFERASIKVTVARDIFPSGFGLLVRTDRAGITTSYDMSETVTASLNASGYLVSGVGGGAGGRIFPENRYIAFTPALAWKFLEWWKLDVSYTYGQRDVPTVPGSAAMANTATLMLTYYPPKLTLSH